MQRPARDLDPKATDRYGWVWTNPIMSSLLQENRDQGVILSTPAAAAGSATWLPDPLPQPLPRFVKSTPLFP